MQKPVSKPQNPCFSSGPCAKRPGWRVEALNKALTGRSHRSKPGKAKLKSVIDRHREILGIPDDYRIAIVPASDTGAVEMALWSLMGARPVDVLAWEAFSETWLKDITKELALENVNSFTADYGSLPDLSAVNPAHDCVFVWNGTTSGVALPGADWIADDREGLTVCDATSAVFAYDLPWEKLDVITWSWQKVLGGEAAHGMIVLSPRAVKRLESHVPPWPLPKIFRMTKGGKINEALFEGATINTPSMLAVEDCLDALDWVEQVGGLKGTMARARKNFEAVEEWVSRHDGIDFLAETPETRSVTSICLKITAPWFEKQDDGEQNAIVKRIAARLEEEGAGYDLAGYRDAPAGFRIWGGATVETGDILALLPWIEWACEAEKRACEGAQAA